MPETRRLWSAKSMQCAISDVRKGLESVLGASKKYNVPRRTLRDTLAKTQTVSPSKYTKPKYGRQCFLSPAIEEELVQRLYRLCDVGFPLTPKELRKSVFLFCKEKKIKVPFNTTTATAGKKWLKLFLNRHDGVRRRKAQNLNEARAMKLNRVVVADYFEKLNNILTELKLKGKPQNVYNMDEKGVRMCLHKPPIVLAKRGARRVHSRGKEHGENVTVVGCGNAIGSAIPPFVIFKGKKLNPHWEENMPTGSKVEMAPKGSMTSMIFVRWLKHFAKFKSQGPCLLILDGAKCHINFHSFKEALKYDIHLFLLPSNTTHELQPFDKSVFRPFEEYWDQEVLSYWTAHPERQLDKYRFGHVLTPTWDRAVTPKNIKAGFAACGIYPFKPSAIPDEAFAPSDVTHRENPEENPTPSTSSVSSMTSRNSLSISSLSENSITPTNTSPLSENSISPILQKPTSEKSSENPSTSAAPCRNMPKTPTSLSDLARDIVRKSTPENPSLENPTTSTAQSKKTTPESSVVNISPNSVSKFHLFSTPKKNTPKKHNTRKGINSMAVRLNRDLFPDDETESSNNSDCSDDFEPIPCKSKKGANKKPPKREFLQKLKKKLDSKKKAAGNDIAGTSSKNNTAGTSSEKDTAGTSFKKDTASTSSKNKRVAKIKANEKTSSKTRAQVKIDQNLSKKKPKARNNTDQEEASSSKRKSKGSSSSNVKSKKLKTAHGNDEPTNESQSWYCYLCDEDSQYDMRACTICNVYVHEMCAGLDDMDTETFVCPRCD